MNSIPTPSFNFPDVAYGDGETMWSLTPLLYKGGAGTDAREVLSAISSGALGHLLEERTELLNAIYDVLLGDLTAGTSRHSTHTRIRNLRRFYSWADLQNMSPTFATVEDIYVQWTESLIARQWTTKPLREKTIYASASIVSSLLTKTLDLPLSPIYRTRVHRKSTGRDQLTKRSEKQNLQTTFAFGNILLDICNCLSFEAVWGSFPITIQFRDGKVIKDWCGLVPPEFVKGLINPSIPRDRLNVERKRLAWEEDKTFRTRHAILNLRIEAELMIFVAQTGMNLAQVLQLKVGKFRYQSHVDGYEVRRIYKNRRKGEVEFNIYSEYRAHFDRYLIWRNAIFPENTDDLLFPFLNPKGRSKDVAPGFSALKKKCRELEISFIRPRALRMSRANWLMRQTRNPALVAEMNQHAQETLLSSYSRPCHQISIVEISRFFAQAEAAMSAPGPGVCVRTTAETIDTSSTSAPQPDCISAAGCLFCKNHRDVDNADHMWSLASYRHLKSLELSKYRSNEKIRLIHPAMEVIKRITDKFSQFEVNSASRGAWIQEANARIAEGDYHPKWDGFIQLLEER